MRREQAVALLKSVGFGEAADRVAEELPETFEQDELIEFGTRYGITRDWLISVMGGSP